ncbi:MAG: hypothetical protein WEA80_05180 [Gemmatimonadaceae bacterium]
MTRRSKLWLAALSLFNLVNAAGAGYAGALAQGEHAAVHVVLLIVGVYASWRIVTRTGAQPPTLLEDAERLEQLQQSVDAIAVEVERIGESQRFIAKLEGEHAVTPR